MIAGPNGSGKSTISSVIPSKLIGILVNPDEIYSALHRERKLDFEQFAPGLSGELVSRFLLSHPLLKGASVPDRLFSDEGQVLCDPTVVDGYFVSALCDCCRRALRDARRSFTFETVMSNESKVTFLQSCRDSGYRSYLYYVATESPEINLARIRTRVELGGHDVPEVKVRERYTRSLALLRAAIYASDRAFLFDNSGKPGDQVFFAEVTHGTELTWKAGWCPNWFDRVLRNDPDPT